MKNHDGQDHEQEHKLVESINPLGNWLQYLFDPHSHGHQQAALDMSLTTDRGI